MKKTDVSLIPVQCECGEFKAIEFGTKDTICSNCHHGMKMTWKDVDPEQEGLKHGDYYEVSYYVPLGGATSFEEASAFEDARETSFNISDVKFKFDSIFENIMADGEKSSDEKISAVEQASKDMVSLIQNPEGNKSLAERLKNLIGLGKDSVERPLHGEAFFTVTKDVNGDWRWLAIFTNHFEDREKEIFSGESHKEYEAWVDESQKFPTLRLWHMPGADIGLADSITFVDGFMLATGTFYEESLDVAQKLVDMGDLGLSHGYLYRQEDFKDGVYSRYRTFEISVLPMEFVANVYTAFTMESLLKEVEMGLDQKKRAFFVDLLGEDRVNALETSLPQLSKDLQQAGVAWKDLETALAPTEENKGDENKSAATTDNDGDSSGGDGDAGTTSDADTKESVTAGVDEKALAATLKEVISPITNAIKAIEEKVEKLQKDDDEKIATRMQQAAVTNGNRASQSPDNVIDGDKTKRLDQAEKDQQTGASTSAARDIVNELLLGKQPANSQ